MTRIWWILIRALKRLKNLHFDWSLLCKVYNVWPEQVQKSYISWLWRVMQNFKKTDLWFGKWHEEFGKFSSEHLKVSKLVFSWDPFVQSRKCMSYKLTEELQVMTLKNDEKFEIEMTCHFEIYMRNLTNFDPKHPKISKICTLMGWFWPKYIMFQLKKYRGVMFDCTQDWYKVWRKTGLCFQKLIWGIWQIFIRTLESVKIGIFMGSFWPK